MPSPTGCTSPGLPRLKRRMRASIRAFARRSRNPDSQRSKISLLSNRIGVLTIIHYSLYVNCGSQWSSAEAVDHPPFDRLRAGRAARENPIPDNRGQRPLRSEEHTSELQSRENLVCRLLLAKKK